MVVVTAALLTAFLGGQDVPGTGPHPCGVAVTPGAHPAWFRCTLAEVERSYMSDFPILHQLSHIAFRYETAVERNDQPAIRQLEAELNALRPEPS